MAPVLDDGPQRGVLDAVDGVRARVWARRDELESALGRGLPDADVPPPEPFCWAEFGGAEVSFQTTWGSLHEEDPFAHGASQHWLDFEDGPPFELDGTAVSGVEDGETLIYAPAWLTDTEIVLLAVSIPEQSPAVGRFPVGFDEPFAGLFYRDLETMDDFAHVAYVVGSLELTAVETVPGGAVEGTVTGTFLAP